MRISFIYRSYEGEMKPEDFRKGQDGRPDYFDKKKCFKSFYVALQKYREMNPGDDWSLYVFHNKEEGELSKYIKSQLKCSEDNFVNLETDPEQVIENEDGRYPEKRVQQHMTTKTVWSKIKEMDTDYFYISEDDYLYVPTAFIALREMFEKQGRESLVTLYDHLDRYTRDDDITNGKDLLTVTPSCHWRTCESTCHSFGISKWNLDVYYGIINPYGKYQHDRVMYRKLYENGVRLWSPIPGKATHMHPAFYSPHVDWKKVNDEVKL